MNFHNNIRIKELNPTLSLFSDRLAHGEIVNIDSVKIQGNTLNNAIELVLNDFQPLVVVVEREMAHWEFLSGGSFILSLVNFIDEKIEYPLDGELFEFRGKFFSELSDRTKITLLNTAINIKVQNIDASDAQKNKAEKMVLLAKSLT